MSGTGMQLEYAMVRLTGGVRSADGFTPGGELAVDSDVMTPEAAGELARSQEVVAIAPAIPLGLPLPPEAVTVRPAEGATAFIQHPVEPHGVARASGAATSTWGVRAVGADTSPATGDGVVVGVIDSGIDDTHPAFPADQITLEQRSFVDGDLTDTIGHGTHCAGTIFGRDVDGFRIGVAPGVRKAIIAKVLARGVGTSSAHVLQALLWVRAKGADIISMSLGIDVLGAIDTWVDQGMHRRAATSMALQAYLQNVNLFASLSQMLANPLLGSTPILVAATGNDSERPGVVVGCSPPGASAGFISVGAVGELGDVDGEKQYDLASFSNGGPRFVGPGVDVLSAQVGGGLVSLSGTSMATPHVAGLAALWMEHVADGARPTRDEVVDELQSSIVGGGSRKDDDRGHGMPRAPQAVG